MCHREHLAAFTEAVVILAASAFDKGLQIQMEVKDDATYALWASVGLETITLAAILLAAPDEAFSGGAVPSVARLRTLDFRTKPFPHLAAAAEAHYPGQPFPPTALSFMVDVRNKLLHTGCTTRVGLVGPTTRMVRDLSRWLSALDLPAGPIPRTMDILVMNRIEELPGALEDAAGRVAADNVAHLTWSIESGAWDDTPELKAVALRELAECRELSQQ